MRAITLIAIAAVLGVSACGQAGHRGYKQGEFRSGETCALVSEDVLPQPVEREEMRPIDDASGECRWVAREGVIHAQLIVYDNASAAKFDELLAQWSGQSHQQPVTLDGVGDRAVMVPEMTGGQTQALVRNGNRLALILAVSGDEQLDGPTLARRIAESVAAHAPAR
jgi:hypothetical protein